MKFYSIECKGKLTLQKVDGLPSFDSSKDEARVVYNTNDGLTYSGNASKGEWEPTRDIEPGTKMLFKQGTAPAGWTFQSEDNDRVLINASTQSDGGDTGGSWTISGGSVHGHTLTEAELPNVKGQFQTRRAAYYDMHSHPKGMVTNINRSGVVKNDAGGIGSARRSQNRVYFEFGSNHSHNHGWGHDGNWRPNYVKVITCKKD